MDNGEMANADERQALVNCNAGKCRFYRGGGRCNLREVVIGKTGQCVEYEVLTADKMRQMLAERGMPEDMIEQIVAEAGGDDGGSD